jgi:hypothetical protein
MNVLKKSELGKFLKSGGLRATLELSNVMNAKGYAPKSIVNYSGKCGTFLRISTTRTHGFGTQRLGGLPQFKSVHGVGRDKCRLCRRGQFFFYKHIF